MAQPKFIDLIREQNERIITVPDQFLSSVKKSQKQIFDRVIELVSQLETVNGEFVVSVKNIELAAQISDELKSVLVGSDYTKALSKFASEFDVQAELTFNYFSKAFKVQSQSEVAAAVLNIAKRNTIDLLVNRAADADFVAPLRSVIENSVINNASYSETLTAIRQLVLGDDEIEGRVLRYSSQIARDAFAVSDASVSQVYADEMDVQWFFYSGAEIDTTRAFCRDRYNQYFHRKEIEAWGEGEKTTGQALPDKDGNWRGRTYGTSSSTIFSFRGGYNCGHFFVAASLFGVPPEVIQRNIDQGFYTPTAKELELLEME